MPNLQAVNCRNGRDPSKALTRRWASDWSSDRSRGSSSFNIPFSSLMLLSGRYTAGNRFIASMANTMASAIKYCFLLSVIMESTLALMGDRTSDRLSARPRPGCALSLIAAISQMDIDEYQATNVVWISCWEDATRSRTSKVINQDVGTEKKHPGWKYDEAPFYVGAAEQDDQRQSVAEERDPTPRRSRIDGLNSRSSPG